MNRNVESHFSELPSIDVPRSIFDRSFNYKTAFNVGDLIPFYCEEILPGDSFRVTTSKVVRLQTLLTPVMDNLYLDTYYFFVPNRLVWNHWKEFCGENTASAWIPQTSYQVPTISAPSGGFAVGTIADYMGLPVGVDWNNQSENRPMALPFRAYALICDEFFRSEVVTDPLNIPLGDSNQTGTNGGNYINDVANGGLPFKVAKYHDVFTSMLPSPQRGPAVTFPLISGNLAPVGTINHNNVPQSSVVHTDNLYWQRTSDGTLYTPSANRILGVNTDGKTAGFQGSPGTLDVYLNPQNLVADLSTSVGAVSINELRLAFQLQRYYEKTARSGNRYTELLRGVYGVVSPDASLQRPEYLGGNRIPINIHEVANTAQTQSDFLGDVGANSVTSDISDDFVHSFTEFGYVIGVFCLRYDHSYPQGIDKKWLRRSFTDFYNPTFAQLGEMPWPSATIYADNTTMNSKDVFGYQEAWAEYRFAKDICTGTMRPGVTGSLAHWNFADYYTQKPTLSDSWIREDKTNVDRTLAVTSQVSEQAFADIYVKNIVTRPMPMYSIPGLIDHH